MSWARSQVFSQTAQYAGTAVASTAVALGGAVAVGDVICLGTQVGADPTTLGTATVTDNLGNTYTRLSAAQGGQRYDAANTQGADGWFCIVAHAGTPTITYTPGGSHAFLSIKGGHFTGSDASSALRDSKGNAQTASPGTGANAITTGASAVAAVAGDLLYAVTVESAVGSVAMAPGAGFIGAGSVTASQLDEWQTSTGAAAATFTDATNGGTGHYLTIGMAISPAGGGGTTGPNGDRWALEGGTGVWLLEAAAGAWLLEQALGTVSKSVPMLTMVAQGAVDLVGSFARAIPMVTVVAAAAVNVGGTAARTMPMLTVAPMQATVAIGGTIAKAVPMLTLAAQATIDVAGTIPARAMPMVTLAGAGAVPIVGTHSPTMPMQTMAAQGTLPITGTIVKPLPMVTLAAAGTLGTITSSAALTASIPMATLASAGASTITGVLTPPIPMVSLAAQGTASQPIVNTDGTLALTVPMLLGDLGGTALFPAPPVVSLPLGRTRIVFDPSRTTLQLDTSRTGITLDPSRTRIA